MSGWNYLTKTGPILFPLKLNFPFYYFKEIIKFSPPPLHNKGGVYWRLPTPRLALLCHLYIRMGAIASKINGTPKGVYLPISKLHSILAVANLLAHNNKSQICYCGQISLQSAAVNCSFSDNPTPLGVTFILLTMVNLFIVRETLNHSKTIRSIRKSRQFVLYNIK